MQGRQLIEEYVKSGKVRFEYRHLAFIGPESVRAAEAAECAADQGHFWEYHDILFENWAGENQGAFSDANLIRFAVKLGLERNQFASCLGSGRYADRVREDTEEARALNVRSTPTIFINGLMLPGLLDYKEYQKIIEDDLAKAR